MLRCNDEFTDQDLQHALKIYETQKGHKFAFLEEHKVLCVNPKWILDTVHTKEQAARRARIAHYTAVRAKLERVAQASPTSKNTAEALEGNKVRKFKAGLLENTKEVIEEEKRLSDGAEKITHRANIGLASVQAANGRTDALLFATMKRVLLGDTSRLPS